MDTASPEDLPPSPALATLQLESLQRKGKRQNNPNRIWPTVQKKVCHFASEFSAVSYSHRALDQPKDFSITNLF